MTNFSELGLAEPLLRALAREGYEHPTPIQLQAIPPLLSGKDVLGIAQTGTGKTAAFALPILTRLLETKGRKPKPGHPSVLVLAPTRELAGQIAESFKAYGRFMELSVAVVVGGVAHGPQIKAISAGLDVLVATPGRLLDHVDSGRLKLSAVEVVVLDEADHMLDLGFLPPIRKILKLLPRKRQNLFFSATMPAQIGHLAQEMLSEPVKISITPVASTKADIEQSVYFIEKQRKRQLLAELLEDQAFSRTVVFARTKRGADRVARHLEANKISAAAIHGNKSQNQRERALGAFRDGQIDVLVATDIAARGIDIDGVTHVINFDLPNVPESYVHRIGRTARGGASGVAIAFCDEEETGLLKAIEKTIGRSIPATDRRDPAALRLLQETTGEPGGSGSSKGRSGNRSGRSSRGNASSDGNREQGTGKPARYKGGIRSGKSAESPRGRTAEGKSRKSRDGAESKGGQRRDASGSENSQRQAQRENRNLWSSGNQLASKAKGARQSGSPKRTDRSNGSSVPGNSGRPKSKGFSGRNSSNRGRSTNA